MKTNVGVMYLSGAFAFGEDPDNFPGYIDGQIAKLEKNKYPGVIVRINSPGGTVAASQHAYLELLRLKEKKNIKVVCLLEDMACSGGIYTAVAANTIIAYPGTMTGSIGAVMTTTNYKELLEKVGLKNNTIKAGEFKDIGSPVRDMTEVETNLLKDMLTECHGDFCEAIATNRNIAIEDVRLFSDGRVLSGRQALNCGLIDGIGGFREAVLEMKTLLGLNESDDLVFNALVEKQGLFSNLLRKTRKIMPGHMTGSRIEYRFMI